jgi:hypothetical protein
MATPFDLGSVGQAMADFGAANGALVSQLGDVIELDPTGRVRVDDARLRTILASAVPDAVAERLLEALLRQAQGGLAVFPETVDGPRSAVPWAVVDDLSRAMRGMPPVMREALGVTGAHTWGEAVEQLRRNYPDVPPTVFVGARAARLTRDPVKLVPPKPRENGGREREEDDGGAEHKPGGGPTPLEGATGATILPPPFDVAAGAVQCLFEGQWDGLGGSWWGWVLGWQVCMDHDCAEKLQDVLASLGGGDVLKEAGMKLLQEGISKALVVVKTSALIVLSVYAILLAANIWLVNGPNGVCIQGNWPVIGGPGAFVWAVSR